MAWRVLYGWVWLNGSSTTRIQASPAVRFHRVRRHDARPIGWMRNMARYASRFGLLVRMDDGSKHEQNHVYAGGRDCRRRSSPFSLRRTGTGQRGIHGGAWRARRHRENSLRNDQKAGYLIMVKRAYKGYLICIDTLRETT